MNIFGFRRQQKQYEKLPTQIAKNPLITPWHDTNTGRLSYLVIDGTAESAASKDKYWQGMGLSCLTLFVGALLLNGAIAAKVIDAWWLIMWGCFFAIYGLHHLWKRLCRDIRICQVWDDRVLIELRDVHNEYALTEVVGIQLMPVDQQRINEELRKKRKHTNPELLEPYSMDLFLQTSLGMEELGSVFGLKQAQEIVNAMNAAIQYMKGRQGTGEGPVLNPAHQYRNKSAGRIPA